MADDQELQNLRAALEAERARHRQQEDALRANAEYHQLMTECVRDFAIFSLNSQGSITTWNEGARRLLGYQTEEALGQSSALSFTAEDRRAGRPERELQQAQAEGSATDEGWTVRKDGSRFWASGFTTALRDESGNLKGFVKIVRDLTERHQAEEALRQARDDLERRVEQRTAELRQAQERTLQAERLAGIGQTVAILAHEGRNALQRTRACLERLAWRLQEQPEDLDLVHRAQQAQEDLQRLFEEVRQFTAPITLDRQVADLAEVWRQAWADLAALRQNRDAQLQEQTGGLNLRCQLDRFRLVQVFRNLFENALAACPDPVRLDVTCTETTLAGAPALRVAVRDNGPGLSAEQQQRIFEPFYTTKTGGFGLGLAIARRIVEAHGGQIAGGEGGGGGAELVITLPRGTV